MVIGTQVALTGAYSWGGMTASLIPFFLVNNLLLLNQFPDVEADRSVGRSNLPILIGRRRSVQVYRLFLGLAMLTLGAAIYFRYLPTFSLIGFLGLAAAVSVVRRLARNSESAEDLLSCLGLNVVVSVATPALVALGAYLG
jgi:1,4-dihydroxy-2-naphthoate octaprenyltransferase